MPKKERPPLSFKEIIERKRFKLEENGIYSSENPIEDIDIIFSKGCKIKGNFKNCGLISDSPQATDVYFEGNFVDCKFHPLTGGTLKGKLIDCEIRGDLKGVNFKIEELRYTDIEQEKAEVNSEIIELAPKTSDKVRVCLAFEASLKRYEKGMIFSEAKIGQEENAMEVLVISYDAQQDAKETREELEQKETSLIHRKFMFVFKKDYIIGKNHNDRQIIFRNAVYCPSGENWIQTLTDLQNIHDQATTKVDQEKSDRSGEIVLAETPYLIPEKKIIKLVRPFYVDPKAIHPKLKKFLLAA